LEQNFIPGLNQIVSLNIDSFIQNNETYKINVSYTMCQDMILGLKLLSIIWKILTWLFWFDFRVETILLATSPTISMIKILISKVIKSDPKIIISTFSLTLFAYDLIRPSPNLFTKKHIFD